MVIEKDARRFIVEMISLEQQLSDFEQTFKRRGLLYLQTNRDYNEIRKRLIEKVCEINSIANT